MRMYNHLNLETVLLTVASLSVTAIVLAVSALAITAVLLAVSAAKTAVATAEAFAEAGLLAIAAESFTHSHVLLLVLACVDYSERMESNIC